jgi:broad specificity phosphatase PhoE
LRGRRFDDLDHNPIAADEGAPNGESMAVFRARVIQAFDEVLKMRAGMSGDLLVVTHGLVMKVILGELVKRPQGVSAPEHFGNTSVSVFDASPPHLTRLIEPSIWMKISHTTKIQWPGYS